LNQKNGQPKPDLTVFKSNWQLLSIHIPERHSTSRTEELLAGNFHPFGGELSPLSVIPPGSGLSHWTAYSNEIDEMDIKKVWEPSRFSWALDLAQTYSSSHNEKCDSLFWTKVDEFLKANPINYGPNWVSAQEVALRLINWIFAANAFSEASSTTADHINQICEAIWQHGNRILPTLDYARSQNNNHILSEALGLIFAGDFLRSFPCDAVHWIDKSEQEFERALLKQISTDGTYSQHSTNYHRMMLQLALLYELHCRRNHRKLSDPVKERLALATRWLAAQLDPVSGRTPNLGHNDGTLLLPFGADEYRDYRPTVQAASIAFLGGPCLPPGQWDELVAWLELSPVSSTMALPAITSPAVHKVQDARMWGTLRAVSFNGRPGHADQLHADLWWDGINIARDAGTYAYNAPSPWQNALDSTRVHNTITIDGRDQMTRVSRFLWLERAQGTWKSDLLNNHLLATHDGYRRLGFRHKRSLVLYPGVGFTVIDQLIRTKNDPAEHVHTLHWLLPDWTWQIRDSSLVLRNQQKCIKISVSANSMISETPDIKLNISLIRGGQTLFGDHKGLIYGWESDTYLEKHPVLSLMCSVQAAGSITMNTKWELFDEPV
jgi:hypothetical protein